jgi:aspartyl-tRNA(Asn)/glutamyl-tRNA(Gln) amidotransferase subunit C
MIDIEQVKHIAELSRMNFTDKELEKFQKDLSVILDYVDELKEVDINGVSPTSHSIDLKNITRIDEVKKSDDELADNLINLSPHKKGRFVKVKPVF